MSISFERSRGSGVFQPRRFTRSALAVPRPTARILAAAIVVLISCASTAQARSPSYVPPTDSSATEYIETLPTAGGGIPTQGVHPGAFTGPGFTQSSAAGGTSGSNGRPALDRRTLRALNRAGRDGARAALLALATAAASVGGHGSPASGDVSGAPSADAQILDALAGSSGQSGLGALLPAILVATAIAGVAVGLRARRNSGGR